METRLMGFIDNGNKSESNEYLDLVLTLSK